uniref:BLTX403 n=1 Tax=Nephila pilipes TaxID=299642 RepID=A0A076L2E0_NEPPI|nr:BLTX403 [Nephila pilipes]
MRHATKVTFVYCIVASRKRKYKIS